MVQLDAPVTITERTAVSGMVLYAIVAACMVGALSAVKVAMTVQRLDDRISALEASFARVEARIK